VGELSVVETPPVPGERKEVATPLVRKLRRKADWESRAEQPEERAKDLFDKLFGLDQLPYNLYQPGNEPELRRVALAMNAARRIQSKLADEAFFIAFAVAEVQAARIDIARTAGETDCRMVNTPHVDLNGTEDQFRALLLTAIRAGRLPQHLTKAVMREFLGQATAEQCRAVPTAAGNCTAASCPPGA
jgi:hypothetical protein